MSRRQAGRRVSSGRGRTGRQANLTGEERFRQTPDALRQRRSKSEGINAATTDAPSANSSPTPQFSTAGENYQGKIGNSDHNNLQPPVDGSSPQILRRSLQRRKKGSALQPEHQTDHNLSYKPRHPSRKTGQRHAKPEIQEIQQQHRLTPVERTPTPDNTSARQATDLT